MGEVVILRNVTALDIPAERVLTDALDAGLKSVIVSGLTEDGNLWVASSVADGGDALWLLELFKRRLMAAGDPT